VTQAKALFDLTGKVALVTGASRGLGQCFAGALASAGADLVVTARKKDDCEAFAATVRQGGRRVVCLSLDVREEASILRMAESAHEAFGRIDVLVNNAGCNVRKAALDVTWDDWNAVLDTNLRGTFFVAKAVARHMIPRGYGRIINIGSLTTIFGYAGIVPYCASRGGVKQLTMSLADEWGRHGITVNCLAPGWFNTEQTRVLYQDPRWVEYLTGRIPLGRPGKPDDLEGAIVFLASDASEYVTGQTLLVDGGMSTGSTKATLEDPRREPAR
jgi:NAD(P)-dependent dehydrogenase (short-subunit alcohol dehydrogenase family)